MIIKRCLSVLVAFSVMLSLFVGFSVPAYAVGESGTTAVGWGTTFYVTKDGTLWGFGKNVEDLIPGSGDSVDEPVQIMSDVKSVCANRYAVVVIKRDASLWYWGRIGGLSKVAQPTKLRDDVTSVAIEAYYSNIMMITTTAGGLYELAGKEFEQVEHPQKVKFVATGGSSHFFINESDELWGWSTDKDGVGSGALGVGHIEPVLSPTKIMDDVQYVASYSSNTMILRKDGALWMCGNGVSGKLYTANGTVDGPVLSPVKVMDNVLHVAMYDARFMAVTRDNALWVWGTNVLGSTLKEPEKVATDVLYATIGGHIAAIKTDNTLWTGGSKDGVYHAEKNSHNGLRLTAQNLQDAPAAWALAEVREAEYRKLVPPAMQSDYSKIVNRSEFCTLAITCIEQAKQMTIESYLATQNIAIPESSPFTDIGGLTERAKKDIMAAYALGIVSGTSATTFDPSNQITREQAAKMLTATADALGKDTMADFPVFNDADMISAWAKPYIGYVFDAKIMSGVGSNKFDPKGGYQRQQAYMTMLRLYIQLV